MGKGGKLFKAIKFRTMGYKNQQARLAAFLRKSALDELPQLINIAKGEMSFVGPRPLIPQEVEPAGDTALRLSVLPGLTGVAQLMASKNAPFPEKSEFL